jgi:hypothetical protein
MENHNTLRIIHAKAPQQYTDYVNEHNAKDQLRTLRAPKFETDLRSSYRPNLWIHQLDGKRPDKVSITDVLWMIALGVFVGGCIAIKLTLFNL